MEFKLNTPLAFSEIGQKPNQEDRICPGITDLSANDRCFVLCDGMGGHEHGEVAAEIVATNLQPALMADAPKPDIMTVERFNKALISTYAALDKMPVDEGKRPGTTMTALYLAENGAFIAHIGDSRVYMVRPGSGVVFRTSDHSLVNQLIKAGELTEEAARTFSRKNVITRAMQPRLETPFSADTTVITDVRAGDYFFMCTDGILENITDKKLVEILSHDISDEQKLEEIYTECYARTRDNFTCILVPVAGVSGKALPTPAQVTDATVKINVAPKSTQTLATSDKAAAVRAAMQPAQGKNKFKTLAIVLGIIAALAIGAAVYFAFFNNKASAEEKNPDKTEEVAEPGKGKTTPDKPAVEDKEGDKDKEQTETEPTPKPTVAESAVEAAIEDVTEAIDKSKDAVKAQDITNAVVTSHPTPANNKKGAQKNKK